MSDVIARILRAARGTGRPMFNAVTLAADTQRGSAIAERLSAVGCVAVLALDKDAAVELLSRDSEFNALVVDADFTRREAEEVGARAMALRPANSSLAVIHVSDDDQRGSGEHVAPTVPNLVFQSVHSKDLAAALDAASRSASLATAEVQRQVEIIARAVIRLGQRLHRITQEHEPVQLHHEAPDEIDDDQNPALDPAEIIASLRSIIRSRRLRERFFRDARFGEPAWDILLDLSLAWAEEKTVSVSSVCIASGVPMSTAMRWISEMVDAGLLERWIDPTDGRRNLVQIAPATRSAMLRYLAALKRVEAVAAAGNAPRR